MIHPAPGQKVYPVKLSGLVAGRADEAVDALTQFAYGYRSPDEFSMRASALGDSYERETWRTRMGHTLLNVGCRPGLVVYVADRTALVALKGYFVIWEGDAEGIPEPSAPRYAVFHPVADTGLPTFEQVSDWTTDLHNLNARLAGFDMDLGKGSVIFQEVTR